MNVTAGYFHSEIEPKELPKKSTLKGKKQYQKGKIKVIKYISESHENLRKLNVSYIRSRKMLVSYAAVLSVITQRSSPLTAASIRTTFLIMVEPITAALI